jgi:predicted acylesterase/phospholipase RssA
LPLTTTTLAARTTDNKNNDEETETRKPTTKREITGSVELESCWDDAFNEAASLSAKGDTQIIGSPDHLGFVHPVVRVLHDRKRKLAESTTGAKSDDGDKKIALVIEGGGMRGCVTAGMVCAIDYLGLRDCVDIVYGSSAGSIIGAYFVTGQLPWFGPELYYDQLTTANKSFIDTNRMLRALGLGALNPKLLKDVLLRRNAGKPVLSLEFLLEETLQRTKPLNWESFVERQKSDVHTQPLKIVAAGLKREETLVMTYEDKHFESLEELAMCMHASSLLPGLAGPMVNILTNHNDDNNKKPKFVFRNNLKDSDYEPLADALVYAPIPYEVAVKEGATHMIVLRSKPDGGDVIGKGGSLVEKLITKRFFLRKNKLPRIYDRLKKQLHKKLYAKSVLELNEAAREGSDGALSSSSSPLPPTLTVAIPGHIAEVPRLEVGREAIFEGVRDGFARAYDTLVEDPSERGKGYEVAKKYFPDEILDYEPHEMLSLQKEQGSSHQKSAFETYLETSGVWPKAWEGLEEPPMGCSADRITATRTNSSSSKETTGAVPQ